MSDASAGLTFVTLTLNGLGRPVFLALFGVLVALLIVAQFEHALATFGSGTSESTRSKTNCPACGARIAVESPQCSHCEHSLIDDESPEYGWGEPRE